MKSVTVFSPAKLNLFLAVIGRRADGFHDLLSLAAPVEWGDELVLKGGRRKAEGGDFTLECSDPLVPVDESNLVLKAAKVFCAATGWEGGGRFILEKKIPMAAGLGGGSSNGVAALRALNTLAGEPLSASALAELAAQLGSDCPLFLQGGPVVMRGRGERIEAIGDSTRLRGRRVLIFKPGFGISTAWAYGRKAESGKRKAKTQGGCYMAVEEAEARLARWMGNPLAKAEDLLFNNLEAPVFEKFVALPALFEQLRGGFGLAPRMTGSGSACFALLAGKGAPRVEAVASAIREAWGPSALVVETAIA